MHPEDSEGEGSPGSNSTRSASSQSETSESANEDYFRPYGSPFIFQDDSEDEENRNPDDVDVYSGISLDTDDDEVDVDDDSDSDSDSDADSDSDDEGRWGDSDDDEDLQSDSDDDGEDGEDGEDDEDHHRGWIRENVYSDNEYDDAELAWNDSDLDEDSLSWIDLSSPSEYLKYDPTPETSYPKPDWITVKELSQRKIGFSSTRQPTKRSNIYWFGRYVYNSLWMVQRLEMSRRLKHHSGCVNCLDFSSKGNLLCSGSDDGLVCVWDWNRSNQTNKGLNHIIRVNQPGNNIFDLKFCNSDNNIVTASRDGTVSLVAIEQSSSERLFKQPCEIRELSFITPQTLVTCGTNGKVNFIDLRIKSPEELFTVKRPNKSKKQKRIPLNTIQTNPLKREQIAVAGDSPYVFLYDLRLVSRNTQRHRPTHCFDEFAKTNQLVTSTAFNFLGDKLLISYNDGDLYVLETNAMTKPTHSFTGHRNSETIKKSCWFGDNFVLSGSDDQRIYGFDLESEHIVCFLHGDTKGAVNCLSVHPDIPVLASSGLDNDVKIFEPIAKDWPQCLHKIKPSICKNIMRRRKIRRNNGF